MSWPCLSVQWRGFWTGDKRVAERPQLQAEFYATPMTLDKRLMEELRGSSKPEAQGIDMRKYKISRACRLTRLSHRAHSNSEDIRVMHYLL